LLSNYFLGEKMQLRKVAISLIIIASLSTLTACGAGENAAARNITKVTDGAETAVVTDTSDLKLRGFLVVAQPDGSAVLVGSIINSSSTPEEILGISINNVLATVTTDLSEITDKVPMIFEGDSANAKAVIPGLGAKAGNTVDISFFFKTAGIVTVKAIVRDQRDTYAGVTS
jgi:Pyruvate/2-oxoacid:ferredoxin oxidoreductase gamma subunit